MFRILVLWSFLPATGKTFVDIVILAVGTLLGCSIMYPMIGFALTWGQFARFTLTVLLVGYCGQSLGVVVASACADLQTAALASPVSIAPFILFSHYSLPNGFVPVYFVWIKFLSPFWWAFDALVVNEFQGLDLECTDAQVRLKPVGTVLL